MILAISLNKISFVVLKSYIAQNPLENMIVLYDKRRISLDEIKIKNSNVKYIKINRFVLIFYALLSLAGKVDKLFIPHHILGRIGNIIRVFAKKVHYIDDGMDTLRDKPKNFDLAKYDASSAYYTFREYKYFGKWLYDKKIEQIASLCDLTNDEKYSFSILQNEVLIIESPGVEKYKIKKHNHKYYLFQHPSDLKRTNWQEQVNKICNKNYSVEKTILDMRSGRIVIGETMSLIIALCHGISENVQIDVFINDPSNLDNFIQTINDYKGSAVIRFFL